MPCTSSNTEPTSAEIETSAMLWVMPGSPAQAVEGAAIDVADVDSGAGHVERPRDRRADAPGARGDQNAQAARRAEANRGSA